MLCRVRSHKCCRCRPHHTKVGARGLPRAARALQHAGAAAAAVRRARVRAVPPQLVEPAREGQYSTGGRRDPSNTGALPKKLPRGYTYFKLKYPSVIGILEHKYRVCPRLYSPSEGRTRRRCRARRSSRTPTWRNLRGCCPAWTTRHDVGHPQY